MSNISLEERLEMRKHPNELPIMRQNWRDLLFLHWKYDPKEIQKTLPPGLFVDVFKGSGYLTISPFSLEDFRIDSMPAIPGFSDFLEVNARTYVYDKNGIPGIWFYSLDLNSQLLSQTARKIFSLPYFFAELEKSKKNGLITIKGKRKDDIEVPIHFSYEPIEDTHHKAEVGTLEFFLLERYVLFSFESNQLHLERVHHQPYPIQKVKVTDWNATLLNNLSFDIKEKPNHMHFSSGVNVDIFSLKND